MAEREQAPPTPLILVVDDDPDILHLLCLMLAREDTPLRVESASGGAEALAKTDKRCPDLVILDAMMPDIDGYEVCSRLRSNPPTATVPIVMLTALADGLSRRRGFEAGADDYLAKPFDRASLTALVRRTLHRSHGLTVVSREGARRPKPKLRPRPSAAAS